MGIHPNHFTNPPITVRLSAHVEAATINATATPRLKNSALSILLPIPATVASKALISPKSLSSPDLISPESLSSTAQISSVPNAGTMSAWLVNVSLESSIVMVRISSYALSLQYPSMAT
jgi:hypothetical protein